MMDNLLVMIAVSIIFIGYTSYTTYKSISLYVTFKKKLAEFMVAHKDATLYKDGQLFYWLSGVLAAFAFSMVYVSYKYPSDPSQVYYVCMAYFCIGIIFVGLGFETYVRKRAYLIDEGMFYVDRIYRYRMMIKFEQSGMFVKRIRVLMANGDKIEISKKFGLFLDEKVSQRKKYKKDKKQNG